MRATQLYGVPLDALDTDPRLHERRLDLAHSAASVLDKNNLIKYDRRSGNFQARRLPAAGSRHMHTGCRASKLGLLTLFALCRACLSPHILSHIVMRQ